MALGDWTARSGPLYLRMADAMRDAVAHGLLAPGARLPAERLLAAHLDVSRGTVVAAYHGLRAGGMARTRRGSGTFLRTTAPSDSVRPAPLLSRLVDDRQVPIDLSIGALQARDGLPQITLSLTDAAQLLPAHGYAPLGAPALRQGIAEHLTERRRVPTRADQVVVTNGGQGALSLIAAALLRPGDRVLVEAPTYPGAIEVFSRAGAEVEGIERDHAGPLPRSLERALTSRPARMLYLVPTCHNPTGGVISESRRHEILRVAATWRVPVIDDNVMADLLFAQPAPPDLAAIDPENVLSVGSLSKSVWGGMRVGWIRAPTEIILRLGRIRAALDLGSPALAQASALAVLGDFDQIVVAARARAQERLGLLACLLRAQLPDWRFPDPAGGWSLWVALPHGSADDLVQLALRHGVAISSGTSAAPDDRFSAHLRLCAGPPPEQIRRGVGLLAQAWEQLSARPAGAAPGAALPV
jgi:DNA-binding transcriptional MocR family regulator